MSNSIGIIFDMDGVIINNHQYHYLSWQELCAKHDVTIDEEFYRNHMNGKTFMGIMKVIFDREINIEEGRKMALEKESIYRDLYRPYLAPTPGLLDLLEAAKTNGVPMAVGTSAPVENVEFTLDGLNIRHYFDAILDDRSVTKGKPDPEIYINCAAGINRKNEDCVVIEDAVSGIQAGKASCSKVIALATSHKREELNADYIYDDFTQFNLNDIKSILAK